MIVLVGLADPLGLRLLVNEVTNSDQGCLSMVVAHSGWGCLLMPELGRFVNGGTVLPVLDPT